MKRLLYFSHTLLRANDRVDPFFKVEEPWLLQHFDRVDVVGEKGTGTVTETGFQLGSTRCISLLASVMLPFRKEVWSELGRLIKAGHFSVRNAARLLFFAYRGIRMALHAKSLLQTDDEITFYSFWMSFDGYAAALCHQKKPDCRFVLRGHAFDVDVERTALNPWLMKQLIADEADGVYLISPTAKNQLMSYMQGKIAPEKVRVLPMGSAGKPVKTIACAPRFQDGVLRLVSCSNMLPIKQLEVLVEALAQWDGMPVAWLHIGDGPEMERISSIADEKLSRKENVAFEFAGVMNAEDVNKLYEQQPFDVMINTSRREGVPVSIMEAMRCGIPAIAPNVGGVPELITEKTGWLYQPETGADGVRLMLEKLCAQTEQEAQEMRMAASEHWNQHYDTARLLPTIFSEE